MLGLRVLHIAKAYLMFVHGHCEERLSEKTFWPTIIFEKNNSTRRVNTLSGWVPCLSQAVSVTICHLSLLLPICYPCKIEVM